jgi:hypothetical protein
VSKVAFLGAFAPASLPWSFVVMKKGAFNLGPLLPLPGNAKCNVVLILPPFPIMIMVKGIVGTTTGPVECLSTRVLTPQGGRVRTLADLAFALGSFACQ